MKQIINCQICNQTIELPAADCLNCQDSVTEKRASIRLSSEEGFRKESFSGLAKLEASNFWFIARNKLILWVIQKYCSKFSSFLEIGCGTGYVISGISKQYPNRKIDGTELYEEGLKYARERLPSCKFSQLDARKIPYRSKYDVIGAFDVLEHIQEDEEVLSQMRLALKDNGCIILTVPQHQWLWSSTDEYACHVRRYSKRELHNKVCRAGFTVIRSSSFVFSLMPAVILSRFKQRGKSATDFNPKAEYQIPKILNVIFLSMLNFETTLIKLGINLPFGSSRLIIAKKIESTSSR